MVSSLPPASPPPPPLISEPPPGTGTATTHEPAGERLNLLARSSAKATAGVFLSRLSGLIRSPIVSAVFGASLALDAFYAAFRFPSALRDLFADGALSSAFTKGLVHAHAAGRPQERRLVASVLGFFGMVTLGIAILACLFADPFMRAVTDDKFASDGSLFLAIPLFMMLAFYLPLAMISSVIMAMLGVRGLTFRATVASAFANIGVVFGALALAPLCVGWGLPPIYGMAIGMLLGGGLQVAYQAYPLWREGSLPWPSFRIYDLFDFPPLREILWLMGPRILGQGALTFALLINTNFATGLGQGALTYITHATVVILVPVGLFGVASGFASLPLLSRAAQEGDQPAFAKLLIQGLRGSTWMSLFTLANFALMAVPLCLLLFSHGLARTADGVETAVAVCAYSVGVLFSSGSKVLVQGLYALGSTKFVIVNAFVYLAVNACASAYFAPRLGVVGLGLASSLAATVDFAINLSVVHFLCKKKCQGSTLTESNRGGLLGRGEGRLPLASIVIPGLLAYAAGWSGIFVSRRFVGVWTAFFGTPPETLGSIVALGCTGSVILCLFIILVRFYGPPSLKSLVDRLVVRHITTHITRLGVRLGFLKNR